MTNTVGDFIKSVFPTLINKNGTIFKALFANENSSGTLEKMWNEIEAVRKNWCVSDLYSQKGEQLEKSLKVFSILEKLQNENEESFLARNKLLFCRKGSNIWGTKIDISKIFKIFFNNENTWIINNCENYSENLLVDGNFEKENGWTLEDCEYEREARFEETQGVLFNASGFCTQTVQVKENKTYFLHFFMQGKLKVKIKDNLGRYWDSKIGEFGLWSEKEAFENYSNEKWNSESLFFITESNIKNITVIFEYENGQYAFLDYVRLFEKSRSQTFALLSVFQGFYSDETARMAPGKNDPIVKFNYENMGYYSENQEDLKNKNTNALSFIENDNSAITENESPVLDEKKHDVERLSDYENITYADETKSLAPKPPVDLEDFESVNYNIMTYFEKAFVFGATGKESTNTYKELLEIVQPAGVTSTVELLIREQD